VRGEWDIKKEETTFFGSKIAPRESKKEHDGVLLKSRTNTEKNIDKGETQ